MGEWNAPCSTQRILRAIFYVPDASGLNRYDRPIEGLAATISLQSKTVTEWRDREIVPHQGNFHICDPL
ncbi:MAG: hypothetical protein IPF59_09455 [Ignavibacteria bacterium]|nr:hypothetical protein [Ignavibacteria bacterium]